MEVWSEMTRPCYSFRDYRWDEESQRYYAAVMVDGKRGLFRKVCNRLEPVERRENESTWYFVRNNQPADGVRQLELNYIERERHEQGKSGGIPNPHTNTRSR